MNALNPTPAPHARPLRSRIWAWFYRSRKVRGLARLCGILIGWKAETSHEAATHALMVLGFFIEGYILAEVGLHQFQADFPTFGGFALVPVLMAVIIFLMLFHQFAIFRNFAVPHAKEMHNRNQIVSTSIDAAVTALRQGTAADEIVMQLAAITTTLESDTDKAWRRRAKKTLELLIYGLFGVLTGEAGYMLTVLHFSEGSHWSSEMLWTLFDTKGLRWGLTLECAFLLCAMAICILILIWDGFVQASSNTKRQYQEILNRFWWSDAFSLIFWCCLFVIVTPKIRWMLGATFYPPALGKCVVAWFILAICSMLYIYKVGSRFVHGVNTLGGAPTYADARNEVI